MPHKVDKDRCVACEMCIDNCPVSAIHLENRTVFIDADMCLDCGTCAEICPNKAIEEE